MVTYTAKVKVRFSFSGYLPDDISFRFYQKRFFKHNAFDDVERLERLYKDSPDERTLEEEHLCVLF